MTVPATGGSGGAAAPGAAMASAVAHAEAAAQPADPVALLWQNDLRGAFYKTPKKSPARGQQQQQQHTPHHKVQLNIYEGGAYTATPGSTGRRRAKHAHGRKKAPPGAKNDGNGTPGWLAQQAPHARDDPASAIYHDPPGTAGGDVGGLAHPLQFDGAAALSSGIWSHASAPAGGGGGGGAAHPHEGYAVYASAASSAMKMPSPILAASSPGAGKPRSGGTGRRGRKDGGAAGLREIHANVQAQTSTQRRSGSGGSKRRGTPRKPTAQGSPVSGGRRSAGRRRPQASAGGDDVALAAELERLRSREEQQLQQMASLRNVLHTMNSSAVPLVPRGSGAPPQHHPSNPSSCPPLHLPPADYYTDVAVPAGDDAVFADQARGGGNGAATPSGSHRRGRPQGGVPRASGSMMEPSSFNGSYVHGGLRGNDDAAEARRRREQLEEISQQVGELISFTARERAGRSQTPPHTRRGGATPKGRGTPPSSRRRRGGRQTPGRRTTPGGGGASHLAPRQSPPRSHGPTHTPRSRQRPQHVDYRSHEGCYDFPADAVEAGRSILVEERERERERGRDPPPRTPLPYEHPSSTSLNAGGGGGGSASAAAAPRRYASTSHPPPAFATHQHPEARGAGAARAAPAPARDDDREWHDSTHGYSHATPPSRVGRGGGGGPARRDAAASGGGHGYGYGYSARDEEEYDEQRPAGHDYAWQRGHPRDERGGYEDDAGGYYGAARYAEGDPRGPGRGGGWRGGGDDNGNPEHDGYDRGYGRDYEHSRSRDNGRAHHGPPPTRGGRGSCGSARRDWHDREYDGRHEGGYEPNHDRSGGGGYAHPSRRDPHVNSFNDSRYAYDGWHGDGGGGRGGAYDREYPRQQQHPPHPRDPPRDGYHRPERGETPRSPHRSGAGAGDRRYARRVPVPPQVEEQQQRQQQQPYQGHDGGWGSGRTGYDDRRGMHGPGNGHAEGNYSALPQPQAPHPFPSESSDGAGRGGGRGYAAQPPHAPRGDAGAGGWLDGAAAEPAGTTRRGDSSWLQTGPQTPMRGPQPQQQHAPHPFAPSSASQLPSLPTVSTASTPSSPAWLRNGSVKPPGKAAAASAPPQYSDARPAAARQGGANGQVNHDHPDAATTSAGRGPAAGAVDHVVPAADNNHATEDAYVGGGGGGGGPTGTMNPLPPPPWETMDVASPGGGGAEGMSDPHRHHHHHPPTAAHDLDLRARIGALHGMLQQQQPVPTPPAAPAAGSYPGGGGGGGGVAGTEAALAEEIDDLRRALAAQEAHNRMYDAPRAPSTSADHAPAALAVPMVDYTSVPSTEGRGYVRPF